ncbi:unnamed protein product [Clonostachys byssicola]|uniref:Secreted protein n=1 Tax=Clonostachys byssicola TaxID=160290 RepID=A0A9N9UAB6_9HYPO|nr:unnamed protein product [Clonostachys byssicola]
MKASIVLAVLAVFAGKALGQNCRRLNQACTRTPLLGRADIDSRPRSRLTTAVLGPTAHLEAFVRGLKKPCSVGTRFADSS